jgi:lysophospholipase L1-like esterase
VPGDAPPVATSVRPAVFPALAVVLLAVAAIAVLAVGVCTRTCLSRASYDAAGMSSSAADGAATASSPSAGGLDEPALPSGSTAAPTPAPAPAAGVDRPPPPHFRLPPACSRVVVFGDSYTEGTGASGPAAAYPQQLATLFGWRVDREGVGGTGFVARGAVDADYLDRLATLSPLPPAMIVVEGGLNDARAGTTEEAEFAAARELLLALRSRYPGTELVVVGPPQTQVVDAVQAVDRGLQRATADLGVPYISPLAEGWALEKYTVADGLHPDDAGHRYFAVRIGADLRRLSS